MNTHLHLKVVIYCSCMLDIINYKRVREYDVLHHKHMLTLKCIICTNINTNTHMHIHVRIYVYIYGKYILMCVCGDMEINVYHFAYTCLCMFINHKSVTLACIFPNS